MQALSTIDMAAKVLTAEWVRVRRATGAFVAKRDEMNRRYRRIS